jgi:hypothetical protein
MEWSTPTVRLSIRIKKVSTEPTLHDYRKFSKNPILNEVLSQTMPFQPGMSRDDGSYGTMNFNANMIGYGEMGGGLPTHNPDGAPLQINHANKEVAAVAKAMTRDYSELVKKFKK